MFICAAVGSFGFASIVTKWPRNKIRIALGTIMIPLAAIMLCKNLGVGPFGIVGTATGLSGWKLIVAAALNILWGALMDIGSADVSVYSLHGNWLQDFRCSGSST